MFQHQPERIPIYRVPHKITKNIAKKLDITKFMMKSVVKCVYVGRTYTHTINFSFKSCTCHWFMAFCVFSHLVAACGFFDQHLDGYTKKKTLIIEKGEDPRKLHLLPGLLYF